MMKFKSTVRVRYADTDQMKFVYNGKYFEYFEIGRTEMMREIGLPYKVIEGNGILMPVIETKITYLSPAYYDELLEIYTLVPEFPKVKVHIDHLIRSLDRNVDVVEGYVELAFLNSKTLKPTRAPKIFLDAIEKFYKNEME
ncbi:MAG: acyl-CoA thioesterase [Ignavibacterium sp.]|nr:acyl-CoA thioesterase [Ignavibacterium sp.]